MPKKIGAVAVIGGGIAGMQAALELADSGIKVYLIESRPGIGGVMSMLDKTFPTNDCAMCTMAPRLVEISRHKDIEVITLADVEKIEREDGNIKIILNKRARFIDEEKCTGCGSCVSNCPVRNEVYITSVTKEVKLEDEDLKRISGILSKYKNKRESLISILQDINAGYRYLPESILRFVSLKLEIPLIQIYAIATFYTAFSLIPRGKYTVSVCLGTACYVKGAGHIMESLERNLNIKTGETTKDMMFSLEVVRCLGCCGLAPVVTINDEIYGKMTSVDMLGVIENIRDTEKQAVKISGKEPVEKISMDRLSKSIEQTTSKGVKYAKP